MAKFTAIDFYPNTLISSDEMNENFERLENLFDNGIGPDNIAPGGFGSAAHGDLSALTDTFHTTESIELGACKAAGKFTSTSVDGALTELSTYVGKATYTSTSVFSIVKSAGAAYDLTNANLSGLNWPLATITIPADSAKSTIVVFMSGIFELNGGGGNEQGYLPLRIKIGAGAATDLSTAGADDPRFRIAALWSEVNTWAGNLCSIFLINSTTVPSLDLTEDVVISAGTAYTFFGTPTCSNVTITALAI